MRYPVAYFIGSPRISTLARHANIPSKYLVEAYKNIAPDLNVKSASSRVEVTRDNVIFILSITNAAIRTYLDRDVKNSRSLRIN